MISGLKKHRSIIFWIFLIISSLLAIWFTKNNFSKAVPLVDIDLKIGRKEALQKAKLFSSNENLGPKQFRQAATFSGSAKDQYYVELDGGGKEVLPKLTENENYHFYQWTIRHFWPDEALEFFIAFTPSGEFYAYKELIPEKLERPNLKVEEALELGKKEADRLLGNWWHDYKLAEKSIETKPNGRVDHTFIFEKNYPTFTEGKLRIKIVISGNKMSELDRLIKIPDSFTRRFEEMRSFNNSISDGALYFIAVFYFMFGLIFANIYLLRKKMANWKMAIIGGGCVALLNLLSSINQWPLQWMNFNTTSSPEEFTYKFILSGLIEFVGYFVLMSLSLMSAEGLTRLSRPSHIQFWKFWNKDVGSSLPVFKRSILGTLLVPFSLSYVVLFYMTTSQQFGWWSPSSTLFSPDILATPIPWLTPLAQSLFAGFWEEIFFRAIPLSMMILWGKHLGRPKLFLILGLIIQALVFGAGHANYQSWPYYSRLIELIIPSFWMAFLYLRFGIIVPVILHTLYDLILFALPIFMNKLNPLWIDQGIIILIIIFPFIIVLYRRIRAKKWNEISGEDLNSHHDIVNINSNRNENKKIKIQPLIDSTSPTQIKIWSIIGIITFFAHFLVWPKVYYSSYNHVNSLFVNQKSKQLTTQQSYMMPLPEKRTYRSHLNGHLDIEHTFIWREQNQKDYENLLGLYLNRPSWTVRWALYDKGTLEDRANEVRFNFNEDGEILNTSLIWPEKRKAPTLNKDQAEYLAKQALYENYLLLEDQIQLVQAKNIKFENRTDWLIVYKDKKIQLNKNAEARASVKIQGDQIADIKRFIHVPQEWKREEVKKYRWPQNFQSAFNIFNILIILILIFMSIMSWVHHELSIALLKRSFVVIFGFLFIRFVWAYPENLYFFSAIKPSLHQYFSDIGGLLRILFMGFLFSLLYSFFVSHNPNGNIKSNWSFIKGISIGICYGLGLKLHHLWAPPLNPVWGDISFMNSFFPSGKILIESCYQIIINFAYMLLSVGFISYLEYKKNWETKKFLPLLIIFGFSHGVHSGETWGAMIPSGIISASLLVFFYKNYLKYSPILNSFYFSVGLFFARKTHDSLLLGNQTYYQFVLIASFLLASIGLHWCLEKSTRPASAQDT